MIVEKNNIEINIQESPILVSENLIEINPLTNEIQVSENINRLLLNNYNVSVSKTEKQIYEVGNVVMTLNSDVTFPIPQSDVINLETDLDKKVEIQVHNQVASSSVWTITRPTSTLPLSVRVVNSAGDEIFGDVTHSGVYTYVTFTQSINGTAYIGVL